MILATFNCFQIPFDVAFEPPLFKSPLFVFTNSLIDIMFALDMIVSFRTTVIDEKTGGEVKNLKFLAVQYIKGQFTIDLLATLPFD